MLFCPAPGRRHNKARKGDCKSALRLGLTEPRVGGGIPREALPSGTSLAGSGLLVSAAAAESATPGRVAGHWGGNLIKARASTAVQLKQFYDFSPDLNSSMQADYCKKLEPAYAPNWTAAAPVIEKAGSTVLRGMLGLAQ